MKHVQDYLRSEGYLSATVGPLELVRRTCDRHSPPGRCSPLPPAAAPKSACTYDTLGIPIDEPSPDPRLTCHPDLACGITCDPHLSVRIPIKLGPRTRLWDVAFDGNKDPALYEKKLAEAADLTLGAPLSQLAIEAARRRVLDAFKELGLGRRAWGWWPQAPTRDLAPAGTPLALAGLRVRPAVASRA